MTRVLRAGAALVLLPVFLGSTALGAPTAAAAPPTVPVKKVVDGDTLDVRIGGRTERVRVIGVDTPEVGECYATEATRRLTALIAKRQVRLVAGSVVLSSIVALLLLLTYRSPILWLAPLLVVGLADRVELDISGMTCAA